MNSNEFGTIVSNAMHQYVLSGYEIREAVAITLGVAMGKYDLLNNKKGVNAIIKAHQIFMEELE